MLKVDNLEKEKKKVEHRTDVVYDFKDMVWYNDGYPSRKDIPIVPKRQHQKELLDVWNLQ